MSRWLRALAVEWSVIVGTTILAYLWHPLWLLMPLVYGSRQAALAVLGHDRAHQHGRMNDALGALAFWPLGVGVHAYRRFHLAHHAHYGTARDTEEQIMQRHADAWFYRNRDEQIARDLIGGGVAEIIDFQRTLARGRIPAAPVAMVALAAVLVACGLWLAVTLWFLSLGTVFWAMTRSRRWNEHSGRPDRRPSLLRRIMDQPYSIWAHERHHKYPWLMFDRLA